MVKQWPGDNIDRERILERYGPAVCWSRSKTELHNAELAVRSDVVGLDVQQHILRGCHMESCRFAGLSGDAVLLHTKSMSRSSTKWRYARARRSR